MSNNVTSRNKQAPIIDENRQVTLGYNDLSADAWGRQKVIADYSVLHGMATFDISPKVWFVDEDEVELTLANTSTRITSSKGGFNISSGAGSAVMRGKRHPRYQPNRGWLFSTAGVLPNVDAFGTRVFGGYTEESGFFFELKDGVFNAVIRQSNWDYFTATAGQIIFTTSNDILSTSNIILRTKLPTSALWINTTAFTVDNTTNTITFNVGRVVGEQVMILVINDTRHSLNDYLIANNIDLEKENVFDIQSQWRGAGDTFFYINLKLAYSYNNLGVNTQPSISNPALPISFSATNGGDVVNMLMGCADISSEGGYADRLEYLALVNKPQVQIPCASVTSPEVVLMVAYSPNYYLGRHNTRDFQVLRISGSTDANAFINVYQSRSPVWGVTTPLLKARTDGSCILYDNALNSTDTAVRGMTFDPTSGTLVTSIRIPANGNISIDNPNLYKVDYTLTHGDYLIITGMYEKNGVANMLCVVELGEEI